MIDLYFRAIGFDGCVESEGQIVQSLGNGLYLALLATSPQVPENMAQFRVVEVREMLQWDLRYIALTQSKEDEGCSDQDTSGS